MAQSKKKLKPMRERTDVVRLTTLPTITPAELELLNSLPLCPHGRRIGWAPCPHCLGLNS